MLKSKGRKKTIGITLGDPAGIGPEVTVKALKELPKELADYVVIGDASAFKPGKPTAASAQAARRYLDQAIELLKNKKIDGLVTAPLSKEYVSDLGTPFEGHTEYLAKAFKVNNVGMLFVAEHLRTIIVTRHIPIAEIASSLNKKCILATIELTHDALTKLFHIRYPRIGVCGLNPHAGEGGKMGTEEKNKILPAIHLAQKHGMKVSGPFPADTLFVLNRYRQFDAIVAMYHDQGLIPIKTLFFNQLVNLTIGLPFIRTSPAHGTAFDIAGKNKADHHSMLAAIKMAVELS